MRKHAMLVFTAIMVVFAIVCDIALLINLMENGDRNLAIVLAFGAIIGSAIAAGLVVEYAKLYSGE